MQNLRTDWVFRIICQLAPALEIGNMNDGQRRFVAITGGTVEGPGLNGRVLAGGGDLQLVRHDGLVELSAQYILESEDGTRIQVVNRGLRHGAPEVLARIAAGNAVDPDEYYCRTTPAFLAPEGTYAWLNRSMFAATAQRNRDSIELDVFRIV